jgi:hypothetical protein
MIADRWNRGTRDPSTISFKRADGKGPERKNTFLFVWKLKVTIVCWF